MSMPTNREWGRALIGRLSELGAETFCFSPGARSSPLVAALGSVRSVGHYDERGTAFFALGAARASGKPAIVITTSGSAVANLLPAVVEAHHAHVPMILMTADRPRELRDRGSNQTITQPGIFTGSILWETEMPCPGDQADFREALERCTEAWARATGIPPGPVHLNVPFREPLLDQE
jgi:2-succinyl-5-enolpyruvyl-6-hydroxy-3-cyclohexene-1-carboxylate synthase